MTGPRTDKNGCLTCRGLAEGAHQRSAGHQVEAADLRQRLRQKENDDE